MRCEGRSGLLSQRHSRRCVFPAFGHSTSIFLRPFARPELPGFVATMDALTPARQIVRRPAGLSASCVWPSNPSVSNHLTVPRIASIRYPSAPAASRFGRYSRLGSGLRLFLASSPISPAESSSLPLRTSRSPHVASHPSSRRRSYVQLQAGERMPEKDSHLSDQTHLQTH